MLSKFSRAVSWIKADQNSAARNFELKVAKILKNPKDLPQRPPKSQKYLHQSSKNYDAKTGTTGFLTNFEKYSIK